MKMEATQIPLFGKCQSAPDRRSGLVNGYNALVLYAGLGGNRALWPDNITVTAVEIENEIARAYQDRFPKDTVVVGDAHK